MTDTNVQTTTIYLTTRPCNGEVSVRQELSFQVYVTRNSRFKGLLSIWAANTGNIIKLYYSFRPNIVQSREISGFRCGVVESVLLRYYEA